jgi:3-oxoacyl-[acyl-carrier protein] reductase
LRLAESGANVVVNYLKSEADANEAVTACEKLGGGAITVQGDVSEWKDAHNIAQKTVEKIRAD